MQMRITTIVDVISSSHNGEADQSVYISSPARAYSSLSETVDNRCFLIHS